MEAPHFRADPAALRLTAALDGMVLIFHRRSGMTHVVASPAPEILDALEEGPATAAELLRRLAERHGLDAEDGAEAALVARIEELESAGLVTRA